MHKHNRTIELGRNRIEQVVKCRDLGVAVFVGVGRQRPIERVDDDYLKLPWLELLQLSPDGVQVRQLAAEVGHLNLFAGLGQVDA
jgi:hypothetical protein